MFQFKVSIVPGSPSSQFAISVVGSGKASYYISTIRRYPLMLCVCASQKLVLSVLAFGFPTCCVSSVSSGRFNETNKVCVQLHPLSSGRRGSSKASFFADSSREVQESQHLSCESISNIRLKAVDISLPVDVKFPICQGLSWYMYVPGRRPLLRLPRHHQYNTHWSSNQSIDNSTGLDATHRRPHHRFTSTRCRRQTPHKITSPLSALRQST